MNVVKQLKKFGLDMQFIVLCKDDNKKIFDILLEFY
jgi:hypothetical protein